MSITCSATRLIFAAFCIALTTVRAQTPVTPPADPSARPLAFDAISIKPDSANTSVNNQGIIGSRVMLRNPPDGFSASNATARFLIANAYDVKEDQVSGGPAWVTSIGYDVEAKVTGTDPSDPHQLTKAQRSQMLQSLLADRFQLTLHTETKEGSIYELTLAKGGSKLQQSKPADTAATAPPGTIVQGPNGPPRGGMMRMGGPGQLSGQAMTMTQLAAILSQQLHRPVVDKTGLTGAYDLTLHWTPDNAPPPPPPPGAEASADSPGPSLFTAVQEQLGLKLESTKGPIQTLVIDHIEQPAPN
jgi:uncharacterized protein (TIGR03435 family)